MVTSIVQLNSIFLLPSTLSAGYHSLVEGFFYGCGGEVAQSGRAPVMPEVAGSNPVLVATTAFFSFPAGYGELPFCPGYGTDA